MRSYLSILILVVTLATCPAEKLKPTVTSNEWAVIGYEAFNPDSRKPRTAKAAAKPPTKKKKVVVVPPKPEKVVQAPTPPTPPTPPPVPKTKTSKQSASDGSGSGGGATKAAIGVGLAVAAAALGGGVLSSDSKPLQPLVAVPAKPVVPAVVPPPPPPAPKPKPVKMKKQKEFVGATIPNEVFNLVKAIVGVGVLSLPAGVAAFGSAPSAFIPAAILITVIGIMSGYGFSLIGRVCAYTGAKSYRDAWSRTVGPSTSWIPAWSTTLKTFLACLAFSMVLADTFSSLLDTDRNSTLLYVTLVVLTPLCMMKDLKSLAPFSLLGVLGMTYTAVAMTVRWIDGTYILDEEAPGEFITQIARHLRPKFGGLGAGSVFSPNALILVCMLSTAYMAHFNAPKFYLELKNNTIERFNSVVSWSFGLSIFLMGFITMVGFLTFGKHCDGLVLNNYASSDVWMGLSRIAVAVSLVFSYPLAFTGCRDGIMDLTQVPMKRRTPAFLNMVTFTLLGVITFLACSLSDVSFVLAFGGATLGNALTYVYPALMYRAVVKQQKRKGEDFGVTVSMISAVLGIIMGVVGASMALKSLD